MKSSSELLGNIFTAEVRVILLCLSCFRLVQNKARAVLKQAQQAGKLTEDVRVSILSCQDLSELELVVRKMLYFSICRTVLYFSFHFYLSM